jgi:hypothetical protein
VSPKNTRHGGPSYAGDPPPPSRRSFGAVLAAAREESKPEPAAGPTTLPTQIVDGASCPTCGRPAGADTSVSPVEGEHGPELPGGELAVGGTVSADWPPLVCEQVPEPISTADLERLGQWLTGPGEPVEGIEVPADGVMREFTTEVEGGEPPSAGSSSSTLPKKQPTKRAPTKAPSRPRARTTANPSKQDPEVVSTADSADAPTTTSASDPLTFPQSTES